MKKFITLVALLAVLLCAMVACSSGNNSTSKDGDEMIGLVPEYVGDTVTDTNHTFSPDDFVVHAVYRDYNYDEDVTDFTYEVSLADGYYTIAITYNGWTEECYVPCEVAVYPSDTEN